MAVRKKIRHDEETRAKIQAAAIINRFHAHTMGEIEMTVSQIKTGEILLRKVLPDLSSVDHTVEHRAARQMTDEELVIIAAGSGNGTADAPEDSAKLH